MKFEDKLLNLFLYFVFVVEKGFFLGWWGESFMLFVIWVFFLIIGVGLGIRKVGWGCLVDFLLFFWYFVCVFKYWVVFVLLFVLFFFFFVIVVLKVWNFLFF